MSAWWWLVMIVILIEDGAEVRDVVYDGEALRLVGFTLHKRGMFAGRLKTLGSYALVVDEPIPSTGR